MEDPVVTPLNEPECVVPPTPSTSDARGNRRRTVSAPENGVAASRVSLIRSTGVALPRTVTGRPAGTGHTRQGASYQVLPQALNGAARCTRQVSDRQVDQLAGQGESVQTWPSRAA